MCAVGSDPVDVMAHLDYFLEHNDEVAKWVAGKAKGKVVSVPGSQSSSASASSSAHPAKATTGAETPTTVGSASATGSAAGASQTSNASTGAGAALSASDCVASVLVVVGMTLFSVALL